MEYITYNRECGFNIINLDYDDIEDADEFLDYDSNIIDYASEIDPIILDRIRGLLK